MAKSKQGKQRPFRPKALERFALPGLYPRMGPGERVLRYTVVVPLEEVRPKKRPKATIRDLDNLEQMLAKHFGGLTTLPPSTGYGLRDPRQSDQEPEMNYNAYFVVYASPLREADAYFRALQQELRQALDEDVILVERQEVWLL
jgi:hypothetical protein